MSTKYMTNFILFSDREKIPPNTKMPSLGREGIFEENMHLFAHQGMHERLLLGRTGEKIARRLPRDGQIEHDAPAP